MKKIIYADNAATTSLNEKAYESMKQFLENEYGNPSQPYSFSTVSKNALKTSRKIIADCINAEPDEIYFTSGGTESDNWAIKGIAFANKKGTEIITSKIEHHAVLKSCNFVESQGYKVKLVDVSSNGTVDSEKLEKILSNKTDIVSIMYANNEIGTIEPIHSLASIAHNYNTIFHTDAVQAVGHVPIDVKDLDVDLLSASAHKFGGPKGIGFLYIKRNIEIQPFLNGGSQENNHRAGTENVASIVGMATALKESCNQINKHSFLLNARELLIKELIQNGLSYGVDFICNGNNNCFLPGLVSVSFKNKNGEQLMHRLDLRGIIVSTGAACDSINTEISHVLKAIKIPKYFAEGTIRISLNKNNSIDDIKLIALELSKIVLNI